MIENIYRINSETGNCVIDVALDDYMDFFHEWDNATFKKRDMHPELAEFLDICSEDIPLKNRIEINFNASNEYKDENKEKLIRESYSNYYTFFYRKMKKKVKNLYMTISILTIVSIFFIFFNYILQNILIKTVWTEVLLEGLTVGGWVFLWEAIHLLVFERHDYFTRNKELKRFLKAPIFFEYKNKVI